MSTGLKYALLVMMIFLVSACTQDKKQVKPAEEVQVKILVSPAIDLFGQVSRQTGNSHLSAGLVPAHHHS